MRFQGWFSIRDPVKRAVAKAADEKRRQPTAGIRKLANLCREYGLRFDSNIRARLEGEQLVLSNSVSEFSLTLKLIDRAYLSNVLDALNAIHSDRHRQLPTPPDQSGPAPGDVHG